jgi:signal transduction histidine kinase
VNRAGLQTNSAAGDGELRLAGGLGELEIDQRLGPIVTGGNRSMDDLLDFGPCGFLSFADNGIITAVNTTLLEMLGFERDEVIAHHVDQILTVGSRIFYQTHWFPLLRLHGRAEEIFLLLRPKTGGDVGVLVNAVRHTRAGGVAYDCVMMQVRERRKYEDELLRARQIAEKTSAELAVKQRDLQMANERLEAQAAELEAQQQSLQAAAEELELAGEELRAINEHLLARTDEAEHLRGVAEEANLAKSRFLAVMSHELRTPLNAIGGYVQLLDMGIHGPVTAAQKVALDRVARSQRHLLRLINDVLDLARIESGRVDYVIEEVPVGVVVDCVAPMIDPQFAAKGITFSTNLPSDLVMRADREKVQQILINLLGNAVKFTPPGGQVTLEVASATDSGDEVLLRITDTGIGIPPEKLESIFLPFVQVDPEHDRVEGSGLGLAISRDLARGMGGDLTAVSRVGGGSAFTLRVRAAK